MSSTFTNVEIISLIGGMWGFKEERIELLEADTNNPHHYVMFEVAGVQYQVFDDTLTIFGN